MKKDFTKVQGALLNIESLYPEISKKHMFKLKASMEIIIQYFEKNDIGATKQSVSDGASYANGLGTFTLPPKQPYSNAVKAEIARLDRKIDDAPSSDITHIGGKELLVSVPLQEDFDKLVKRVEALELGNSVEDKHEAWLRGDGLEGLKVNGIIVTPEERLSAIIDRQDGTTKSPYLASK